MPIYIISRREVHVQYIEIEANSPTEAIKQHEATDEGTYTWMEYSHTLDSDKWTCEISEEEKQ